MSYSSVPDNNVINNTAAALAKGNIRVVVVNNRKEALDTIIELIPAGSAVMNGSSTTLIEIGYFDHLKSGNHRWKNLHDEILKEEDEAKRAYLRRRAIVDADYFLGSVNAITEDGKLVAVDQSGSRVGAYPFAARKLLLVAGAQKIVPDLDAAIARIRQYVFPRENERAKKTYGINTSFGKWVIMEKDSPGRTTLILVKEVLGF